MPDFLAQPLATIALCWRLERRDGVALGFTSHDRDLVVGGLSYRAAPGMLPSAVTLSDGFDAHAMDVSGVLSGAAISEVDLAAGRWDGARLALFAIDWSAPGEAVPLARGTLGAVEIEGKRFTAELRGPAAALERAVVEETSPECRADLGDRRCRVDMAGRRRLARVVSALDEAITIDAAEPSGGAYGGGLLRWIGGANSGLVSQVLISAGATVTLREPPALTVVAGDLVKLSEGCDKSLATCAARFGNALNFRGEPHLPGNDLLTRYPGG